MLHMRKPSRAPCPLATHRRDSSSRNIEPVDLQASASSGSPADEVRPRLSAERAADGANQDARRPSSHSPADRSRSIRKC